MAAGNGLRGGQRISERSGEWPERQQEGPGSLWGLSRQRRNGDGGVVASLEYDRVSLSVQAVNADRIA